MDSGLDWKAVLNATTDMTSLNISADENKKTLPIPSRQSTEREDYSRDSDYVEGQPLRQNEEAEIVGLVAPPPPLNPPVVRLKKLRLIAKNDGTMEALSEGLRFVAFRENKMEDPINELKILYGYVSSQRNFGEIIGDLQQEFQERKSLVRTLFQEKEELQREVDFLQTDNATAVLRSPKKKNKKRK